MKYLSVLLFLGLFACTQDFTDLNTNENAPSEVQPELLLRQVLYGYGDAMSYEGFVAGNLLSQHFAMIDFNLFDRHALSSPQEGGDPWPILYTNLRDTETILELSRANPAQAVYEGPALVLKAYLTMTLTDLYGDVPYSNAFRGRSTGIVQSTYDRQEDIYLGAEGILQNLTLATTLLAAYSGPQELKGDILYDGDLAAWGKFATSLALKVFLRIGADVEPGPVFNGLLTTGNYLATEADNATFAFTAGPPNDYPLARARIGIFNVFLMSETAAEVYAAYDSPLREVHFRPGRAGDGFRGVANGIAAASSITPDDFARPGLVFREQSGGFNCNFLTSWETHFLLAEAALKGWLEGVDPQELYETAVRQAFAYWRVEMPARYLIDGPGAYDPERALEQIITQKWMASIGNAYEGWTEWRRTGYPSNLRPAAASLNEGRIPIRMPYPNDEQALNFENYSAAAAATNGNSINAPVWWDVD